MGGRIKDDPQISQLRAESELVGARVPISKRSATANMLYKVSSRDTWEEQGIPRQKQFTSHFFLRLIRNFKVLNVFKASHPDQ